MMKPSHFNVLAPAANGTDTLLYNTLSGACALLDEREVELYGRVDSVDEDSPDYSFVQELAEDGFVAKDPGIEVSYLRDKFNRYKFNTRVLELYITPTLDCNMKCVYCFEHKRRGHMTLEVEDGIVEFVKRRYAYRPFQELKIAWYGGEPLLRVGTIKRMSEKFIEFCDANGLEYYANVVTNGLLATEEVQQTLVDCRVWQMQVTVDGADEMQDRIRRPRNGKPSFDAIMNNIDGCLEKGMCVNCHSVVNEVNVGSCIELAKRLAGRPNVAFGIGMMHDMTEYHLCDPCGHEMVDLTDERFAQAYLEVLLGSMETKEDFEHALRPLEVHCPTAIENAYVIDELGNAYACGSVVGQEEYILFNVLDPTESDTLNRGLVARYGVENPVNYEECSTCSVLPICKGGCTRLRMEGNKSCSAFKYIIGDFLTEYSKYLI